MMYQSDYLAHYGVKGQKWGVRNYQNEDGSLTEAGKKRYGYAGDKSGRFDGIKQALKTGGNRAVSRIRRAISNKKERFIQKHKNPANMTDQELRERTNRMQMEANYKRLQSELSGKNTHKQTFGERHPLIRQIAISTTTQTLSNLVGQQLNTKADELFAEGRMKRAKEKGMLDPDLIPFQSKVNAGRNAAYNKAQKDKADAAARTMKEMQEARERAAKEAEAQRQREKDAYVNKYHLAPRKDTTMRRIKASWASSNKDRMNTPLSRVRRRPQTGSSYTLKGKKKANETQVANALASLWRERDDKS